MTRVDKIRLSDRIRRIEMIGRHVGVRAFVERSEVTGKDGGPIKLDISNMTDEQIDDELRTYGFDPDKPTPTADGH